MILSNEMALVEAVLYLENEPIDIPLIARILGIPVTAIEQVLSDIGIRYEDESHGMELQRIGDMYQLVPKRTIWPLLKDRYGRKNDSRLSRAAMETLAIIAYSQPVTRSEIENIRGVASDGMIRLLLTKELIQEIGKKNAPGRPSQFGTTKQFLKVFHLASIADLPKLDELDRERFELDG